LARVPAIGMSNEERHAARRTIPAGLDAEKHQLKTPPIMFDRTPADEIVVPGRWWQLMFENVSADAAAPTECGRWPPRWPPPQSAAMSCFPGDSDTVEIAVPDSQGNMATYEALPPGTRMRARLDRNPSRAETCGTFKPQEDSIVAHPVCAQFVPNSGAL